MPARAICPACSATYTISETLLGKDFICRKCAEMFRIPSGKEKPQAPPKNPTKLLDLGATEPESLPVEKPKPITMPARRTPRPVEPDDSDERPRYRPRKQAESTGSNAKIYIGVGIGAAVLLAGVLAVVFWPKKDKPSVVSNDDDKQKVEQPTKNTGTPGKNKIEPKKPLATKPPEDEPKPPVIVAKDMPDEPLPVNPLPIVNAPLKDDKTSIQLPGIARDLCVGGDGRFVILHLPQERQLAVFDLNEAKIAKLLPLAENDVFFAAGKSKLIVIQGQSLMQRYSLQNFEREQSIPLPFKGTVQAMAMGSASEGPLLIQSSSGVGASSTATRTFYDIATMKAIDYKILGNPKTLPSRDRYHYRASPDGTVFGFWCSSHTPSGLGSLVLERGDVQYVWTSISSIGHVVPAGDGKLYTAMGPYSSQHKALYERVGTITPKKVLTLPADYGNYYVKAEEPKTANKVNPADAKTKLSIFLTKSQTLLTTIDADVFGVPDYSPKDDFTADKRIQFVPSANALVVVPPTNDRLVVHRLNVEETLKNSGVNYLMIKSRPPLEFAPGQNIRYPMVVAAKNGDVKYRVDAGPTGLSVGDDGQVRWAVPANFSEAQADVIITVSDGSGQEIFHSFRMRNKEADRTVLVRKDDPPVEPMVNPAVVNPPVIPDPPKKEENPVQTVRLPASIGGICLGGNGRYIILHLPQERKLAIFDATEIKIVKFLPIPEDTISFAAGIDKLFVALPGAGVIQRYNLATFEKEVTVPSPVKGTSLLLVMGHASRGPLMIGGSNGRGIGGIGNSAGFFDPRTLKELPLKSDNRGHFGFGDPESNVRVSADGQVFASWRSHVSPQGVQILCIQGNLAKISYSHDSPGYLVPSPEGRTIYSGSGNWTQEAKRMGDGKPFSRGDFRIPSVNGNYYISVIPTDRFDKKVNARTTLHLAGDERPLITLPTDLLTLTGIGQRSEVPDDRRLMVIPDHNLIVAVPTTMDKLEVRKLDIDDALEKSGVDYLFVRSQPPAGFTPGRTVEYQIAVKSKKGGVKYKLESGPKGMTVSPEGKLVYLVPPSFTDKDIDVLLTVSDAGGQEIFHSFKLQRGADSGVVVAKKDDKMPDPIMPKMMNPDPEPPVVIEKKGEPIGEKQTVQLPASIGDICLGGNGRYVIMHLPQQRKLAVFDAKEGKVTKYLPVAEDVIAMAAGMDKLFVGMPAAGVIQRYSLETFAREVTVPAPLKGTSLSLAMGHASQGPLLVTSSTGDRFRGNQSGFYDPKTFKELPIKSEQGGGLFGFGDTTGRVRVSANGQIFTHGGTIMRIAGNRSIVARVDDGASYLSPAADGKVLYSFAGRFTPEGKRLGDGKQLFNVELLIPSVTGNYYVSTLTDQIDRKQKYKPTIQLAGDTRPLITLSEEMFEMGDRFARGGVPFDLRLMFMPDYKLVIVVPPTLDKLETYRLDIDAALENSGVDYLIVTSQPPEGFAPGTKLDYQMVVKSKKGGVKYKVESGPDGMAVAADGKLTWAAPKDFGEKEVNVILTVSDSAGQEVFHTFALRSKTAADTPNPAPPDKKDFIPKLDLPKFDSKEPIKVNPPKFDPKDFPKIDPKDPPKVAPMNTPKIDPKVDPKIDAKLPPPKEEPRIPDPPEPKIEIKPSTPVGAIKSAPLKEDKEERTLPSAIADLCVGGGGRFLIMHLPKERKLAIFDVNEAKITKYLPLPSDSIKFAAGQTRLVVIDTDAKLIQRYSLATFEKEVTVASPVKGTIKTIALGCASEGPLLVDSAVGTGALDRVQTTFLNIASFKDTGITGGNDHHSFRDMMHYRASPDGRVFGVWCTSHSPSGVGAIIISGKTAKKNYQHDSAGAVLPSPDGRLLYTGHGVYTSEVKLVGEKRIADAWQLPAVHGNYVLSLSREGDNDRFAPREGATTKFKVAVHMAGDSRALAQAGTIELAAGNDAWATHDFTSEKRLHFIPAADLIVAVAGANDKLVLHRFGLDEALEKSGVDYLFVASQPVTEAKKGAAYAYPVMVRSKKGGVKIKVESGPEGLKASPDGKLTWTIPNNQTEKEVDVLLTISDASGQEVFHSFKIAVKD